MDPSYELKYHKFENNYFWFKARRDIIFKLLQTTDRNDKILDLGCSSGELIEFLNTKYFNNHIMKIIITGSDGFLGKCLLLTTKWASKLNFCRKMKIFATNYNEKF